MRKLWIYIMVISIITLTVGCTPNQQTDGTNQNLSESIYFEDYEGYQMVKETLADKFFTYEDEQHIESKNVREIMVEGVFENITFIQENREDILVSYYGIFEKGKNNTYPKRDIVEQRDVFYSIKWENFEGQSFARVEVRIPEELYVPISAQCESGNIEASYLESSIIQLKTSSGNISLKNINTDSLIINSNSGNIEVLEGVIYKIDIVNITGNIITSIIEQKNNIEMVNGSGNIIITAVEIDGKINAESSSGQIKLDDFDNEETYSLTMRTESGNISLTKK